VFIATRLVCVFVRHFRGGFFGEETDKVLRAQIETILKVMVLIELRGMG
jgi:hypothetical protein